VSPSIPPAPPPPPPPPPHGDAYFVVNRRDVSPAIGSFLL
jgi:hypothetical protein